MKLSNTILGVSVLLLGTTKAVDMSRYAPGTNVEPGFRTWLSQLYIATETLNANRSFTDFFVYPNGVWRTGNQNFTGAQAIITEKYRLLPPSSGQVWSHIPNVTTVYSETNTEKTYLVLGVINKDLAGTVVNGVAVNNCSANYYTERFTVRKYSPGGAVNLAPDAYSLVYYNELVVQPPYQPTNIVCESPAG